MAAQALKRVRTRHFQNAKDQGIKITGLTSYDQLTAQNFDAAGIDFLREAGIRRPAGSSAIHRI